VSEFVYPDGPEFNPTEAALNFLEEVEAAEERIAELIGLQEIEKVEVSMDTVIAAIRTMEMQLDRKPGKHSQYIASIEGVLRAYFEKRRSNSVTLSMMDIGEVIFTIPRDEAVDDKQKLLIDIFLDALAYTCERSIKKRLSENEYIALIHKINALDVPLTDLDGDDDESTSWEELEDSAEILEIATGDKVSPAEFPNELAAYQSRHDEAADVCGALPIDRSDPQGQATLVYHLRQQAERALEDLRILEQIQRRIQAIETTSNASLPDVLSRMLGEKPRGT
jgi:hypothetical protein